MWASCTDGDHYDFRLSKSCGTWESHPDSPNVLDYSNVKLVLPTNKVDIAIGWV